MMDVAELKRLIADGEGETVEFKSVYPSSAHKLAKEIAAFASTDGGKVLLGVADDKTIVGLNDVKNRPDQQALIERIEGLCAQVISPPVSATVRFVATEKGTVAIICVPATRGEIHYVDGRPYMRIMSISRVATPQEVKHRILMDDVLGRLQELEARHRNGNDTAAAIIGQGELATMNRSDIMNLIRHRESRKLP